MEAGLRSFDRTMPEEINRMVTDAISDYFFVTEESGEANLNIEGKSKYRRKIKRSHLEFFGMEIFGEESY